MQDFKKSRQNSRSIHFFQTLFLSNASDAAVPCGSFSRVTFPPPSSSTPRHTRSSYTLRPIYPPFLRLCPQRKYQGQPSVKALSNRNRFCSHGYYSAERASLFGYSSRSVATYDKTPEYRPHTAFYHIRLNDGCILRTATLPSALHKEQSYLYLPTQGSLQVIFTLPLFTVPISPFITGKSSYPIR